MIGTILLAAAVIAPLGSTAIESDRDALKRTVHEHRLAGRIMAPAIEIVAKPVGNDRTLQYFLCGPLTSDPHCVRPSREVVINGTCDEPEDCHLKCDKACKDAGHGGAKKSTVVTDGNSCFEDCVNDGAVCFVECLPGEES